MFVFKLRKTGPDDFRSGCDSISIARLRQNANLTLMIHTGKTLALTSLNNRGPRTAPQLTGGLLYLPDACRFQGVQRSETRFLAVKTKS